MAALVSRDVAFSRAMPVSTDFTAPMVFSLPLTPSSTKNSAIVIFVQLQVGLLIVVGVALVMQGLEDGPDVHHLRLLDGPGVPRLDQPEVDDQRVVLRLYFWVASFDGVPVKYPEERL